MGRRARGVWGRKSGPSELRCGRPHLLPPSRCHCLHERHASGENLFRPTIIQALRPPQRPGAGVPRGVAAGRPLRLTRGDGVIKVIQRPGGGCSRLPASGRGAARDCHDAPHRRAAGPSVRRYFGVIRHWACFEERSIAGGPRPDAIHNTRPHLGILSVLSRTTEASDEPVASFSFPWNRSRKRPTTNRIEASPYPVEITGSSRRYVRESFFDIVRNESQLASSSSSSVIFASRPTSAANRR